MAQTKEGALKVSAQKAGMIVEDYIARIESGEKRCTRCKEWKPIDSFGKDRTRSDGMDCSCFDCRRVKVKVSTKGRVSTFKGQTHSSEAKALMSKAHIGIPSPKKGVPRTAEEKGKISASARLSPKLKRGEEHYAFSHGRSQRALDDRRSPEYKTWRDAVFARDRFTCQECGDATGGNLRAHHIQPFAAHPDLRFVVTNGVTRCHDCHELKHYMPDSVRNLRKAKRGKKLH